MHDAVVFNRRVSNALLRALGPAGFAAPLVARRNAHRDRIDLELCRDHRGPRSWASLYVGLTSILDLEERAGTFRLSVHATHQKARGFRAHWLPWQAPARLAAAWPEVERYLDRADAAVASRHIDAEGSVQAAIASGCAHDYFVIQREGSPSFSDQATRDRICAEVGASIHAAVEAASLDQPWWPGARNDGEHPHLGTSPDFVAVDRDGRLLVIEAQPAHALEGIVWGPAQVRFHAELMARVLTCWPEAVPTLNTLLDQRVGLGLTNVLAPPVVPTTPVVPVLAIGDGAPSPAAQGRSRRVADAVSAATGSARVAPLEVWKLDCRGCITERWR